MSSAETVLIPPEKESKSPHDSSREATAAWSTKGRSEPAYEAFKGLCLDCEHRYGCPLSHTPGGVWNCNEYA